MKLVFYSGGQSRSNHVLHAMVSGLAGPKKRKSMTYVPFCSENAALYFSRAMRRYRKHGVSDFHCLPVDAPLGQGALDEALKSDIVYLAGGNTFYFLKHLKTVGALPRLLRYAERGGVLAGLSAGALIMSPNIGLAAVPSFDADENDVGLTNLSALGLVPFEFYPHYMPRSKRLNETLLRYSRRCKHPVYAAVDGSGIVVDGPKTSFVGVVHAFHEGRQFRIG